MNVTQTGFRNALLDPALQAPAGLSDGKKYPAGKRFDVYRNNVTVSLMEAMVTGFPLITKLLGHENMDGLARMYARAHPPDSPLMMHYGHSFPDFLSDLPQLSHLGYLPDVARVDLALRKSYHAADVAPIDPAKLADITSSALLECHVTLAPALVVLRSDWPIYDIWRFNTQSDAPKPNPVAQDVLIVRPEFDPEPHLLPDGGATWVDALQTGQTIGEALNLAQGETEAFDLSTTLTLLITGQALTSLSKKD